MVNASRLTEEVSASAVEALVSSSASSAQLLVAGTGGSAVAMVAAVDDGSAM